MKKIITISVLFLLLISCARQRQVWLGALQRTHSSDHDKVVRVYFDKWGDLYPSDTLGIPYKSFLGIPNSTNTYKENGKTGSLVHYYTSNRSALEKLAKFYGQALKAIDEETFYSVQGLIRERKRAELIKQFDSQGTRTLVVFIHGFNDPDPTGDYQQMRDSIRLGKFNSAGFVYLEVFWDGLTCNQGNPALSLIWGRAQQNSAYTGLGLRNILNELPGDMKIRIITHSLGASVGTTALFNTFSKWDMYGMSHDYTILAKSIKTPPQADIRIGMLAPAIPGENTFTDINERIPVRTDTMNINKIIVGYNVNDLAVTKRVFRIDIAGKAGATSLGCNRLRKDSTEIEVTIKILKDRGHADILKALDFSQECRGCQSEEHGCYYYLLNKDRTRSFFNEVFE